MFRKLLIANRGEIAVRIMRTARRLGIATVAVYSDADEGALHVAMADEAYRIGPPPASQSYLNQQAVIEIARRSRAEAIHPGYGFLAENPDFAESVKKAGLIFVGPPASAIRAMGLKDEAKRLMQMAGVPVLSGYHGEDQEPSTLAGQAKRIGYPVLIKPVAGGGGKGMRRVEKTADFAANLEAAAREAVSAFGDERVLIEKFLPKARHIEIQILADAHGNIIHLFERDCSLQRRHQKVIEEAPAPGLSEEMRTAMCKAAIAAAKSVGYVGAGTVEFIVDVGEGLRPDRFYFMEMNTRLQVEHPVTEMITGLDLVELQLRIAGGEALPVSQREIRCSGHAIEARLYAEDPAHEFQPQTGRIRHLSFPQDPQLRVDTGVREGDTITPFYDPMIAKLIVHAPSRAQACAHLSRMLGKSRLVGCRNNLTFLARLARQAEFLSGDPDTELISRNIGPLVRTPEPSMEAVAVALLGVGGYLAPPRTQSPFDTLTGFRMWSGESSGYSFLLNNEVRHFTLAKENATFVAGAETSSLGFRLIQFDSCEVRIECDGRIEALSYFEHDGLLSIVQSDVLYELSLAREAAQSAEDIGGGRVVSPVPGLVRRLFVAKGADVRRGDTVAIVEAMKMEFPLKAERDGRVTGVHASEGSQIAEGKAIATIGEDGG
jgi:3-methylcrotonyl-CoA carboxylase alpha subunit